MTPDIQGQEREPVITTRFLRTVAQDLITFLTLFALVVWPLLNLAVFGPQEQLAKRLDKLEQAHEETRASMGSIDKNLAVLAESTKRTDEALQAIRQFLAKDKHQ